VDLELNLTERLFAAKLGVQPLYFRPPYSIDQEPDTNDQAAPADRIQDLGYVIVGDKIDTDDWDEHPRKTPQEITDSVFQQIDDMQTRSWMRGSIILLHDGGGDRSATVAALPVLIQALRDRGYRSSPVSQLMGKTRAEVMPPLNPSSSYGRRGSIPSPSSVWAFFNHFVIGVFFVGDILMSARLIIIGSSPSSTALRKRKNFAGPDYMPRVAVLIPAYNEEKVIVRTIRSVMMSNYKNIRIIVIDDGSKDNTYRGRNRAYPKAEIASGRLTVLTKPNGGKADALNYALEHRRRDLHRHRRRRRDRARCHHQPGLPLRQPEDRRRRRQCQGRQSRQPVDALAGARIHHQPELRAPRAGSLRRGDGGARSHRRVAHRGREGRRRLPHQHRRRRRRPHHEPARAGLLGHL
jgi:hypothetical protein